jgi:hypothetical protein
MIIITSSGVIRSFLPLDRYGIRLVHTNDSNLYGIINQSDTVMFSMLSFWDYKAFCNIHRSGVLKGKRIIVGGALLNIIKHPEQLLKYFTIDHICVGKGERFIKYLCEGESIDKVYYENNPVSQFDILMDNEKCFWALRELNLLLNYRCRWSKCLFCHHGHDEPGKNLNASQLGKTFELVRRGGLIRKLNILDSDLDIGFFVENILEDEQLMLQLEKIFVFGIRCDSRLTDLKRYIERYQNVTFRMNFGLEFVTQFFIDLYQKGYDLDRFLSRYDFLFSNGFTNLNRWMYCLVGMPLMNTAYYRKLSNFIGKYKQVGFNMSYFLMNDAVAPNFKGFSRVEILGNIDINEFNSMEGVPSLKTVYRHFLYHGRSQYEHFSNVLVPSGLLKHRNAGMTDSLYPFALPVVCGRY